MDVNCCFIFSIVVYKFHQKDLTNRLNRNKKKIKNVQKNSIKKPTSPIQFKLT